MLRMARSDHNSPDSFQRTPNGFLSSSFTRSAPAEISQMKARLARVSVEVRTALPHLRPSSEVAQKQLAR
jgi:hypothetical protein